MARQQKMRSVVLTFWPHPRQVLDGESAPLLLNTLEEKLTLISQAGIDDIIVHPFDQTLAQMSADEFVSEILAKQLKASHCVLGEDHHFGNNRDGNSHHPSIFTNNHIQVEIINLKKINQKISSSSIRKLVAEGDIEQANRLLCYEYIISGKVVDGNRLGRTIGFPTANIEIPAYKLLPKDGAYRVKLKIRNQSYLGMLYIGNRPVLKEQEKVRRAEVHIFDFEDEIYGEELKVALTHRLRDDVPFDNIGQLKEQLYKDKQAALSIKS